LLSAHPWFSLFSGLLKALEPYAFPLAESPRLTAASPVAVALRALAAAPLPPPGGALPAPRVAGGLGLPLLRVPADRGTGAANADVFFAPLLWRVPIPAVLNLFAALLAERRVVITATDVSALSAAVHAAAAMLYPLTWQHIFLPVLPATLLDYLSAPMPFLVGLPATLAPAMRRLPMEEIVLLNLDTGIIECFAEDLALLPRSSGSRLAAELGEALKAKVHRDEPFAAALRAFFVSTLGDVRRFVHAVPPAGRSASGSSLLGPATSAPPGHHATASMGALPLPASNGGSSAASAASAAAAASALTSASAANLSSGAFASSASASAASSLSHGLPHAPPPAVALPCEGALRSGGLWFDHAAYAAATRSASTSAFRAALRHTQMFEAFITARLDALAAPRGPAAAALAADAYEAAAAAAASGAADFRLAKSAEAAKHAASAAAAAAAKRVGQAWKFAQLAGDRWAEGVERVIDPMLESAEKRVRSRSGSSDNLAGGTHPPPPSPSGAATPSRAHSGFGGNLFGNGGDRGGSIGAGNAHFAPPPPAPPPTPTFAAAAAATTPTAADVHAGAHAALVAAAARGALPRSDSGSSVDFDAEGLTMAAHAHVVIKKAAPAPSSTSSSGPGSWGAASSPLGLALSPPVAPPPPPPTPATAAPAMPQLPPVGIPALPPPPHAPATPASPASPPLSPLALDDLLGLDTPPAHAHAHAPAHAAPAPASASALPPPPPLPFDPFSALDAPPVSPYDAGGADVPARALSFGAGALAEQLGALGMSGLSLPTAADEGRSPGGPDEWAELVQWADAQAPPPGAPPPPPRVEVSLL
jgi:hypothetical protein